MKILITNVEMEGYSGTTLYVKELAIGFKKRGIHVEVFTLRIGQIGEELLSLGIRVSTKLTELSKPDIVHAHNNITVWPVLSLFKNIPVVFWIHNRLSPLDIPPKHKNIIQYMAVDYNCYERYIEEHKFQPKDIKVIYNWVNLTRFSLRKSTNGPIKKALVFSNYAKKNGFLPVLEEACESQGIELDVMGKGMGTERKDPENYLGDYDVVFAKAKAAMEAMACGCAVIVCDFNGLAGFAKPTNFEEFRKLNFGMKLMNRSITVENVVSELKLYQSTDFSLVSRRLREEADMELVIDDIRNLYQSVIEEFKSGKNGEYKFNVKNYLEWRRATFRIWIGLWLNLNLPKLVRSIKRLR